MQEIGFDAGLRLQSLREHAVHLEGKKKLTLRESRVVLPARLKSIKARDIAGIGRSSPRSWSEQTNKLSICTILGSRGATCSDPSLLSFAHLASGLRSHALTFHWSRQPPPLLFAEALGNWLRSHGAVRGAGGRAMKASEPRLNEIVVRGVRKSK